MIGCKIYKKKMCANSLDWARENIKTAPHGAVFLSDNHEVARGRDGRLWKQYHGQLLVTVLLKPVFVSAFEETLRQAQGERGSGITAHPECSSKLLAKKNVSKDSKTYMQTYPSLSFPAKTLPACIAPRIATPVDTKYADAVIGKFLHVSLNVLGLNNALSTSLSLAFSRLNSFADKIHNVVIVAAETP